MALTEPAAPPAGGAGAGSPAAPAGGSVPGVPTPVRRRALLGSRRRQIGAGVVIAGAIGFLVFQGLGNATQYYKTVPQAIADRASLGHNQFRIMGTVDHNVRQVSGKTEFSISYAGSTAQVVDQKEPPQLFKPGIPVVLEGHWSGNVFHSDLIMVKHTAVYNPAERTVMSTMPGNDASGQAKPPAGASHDPAPAPPAPAK